MNFPFVECPICFQLYDADVHAPCALACGHTFCINHEGTIKVCPFCQIPVPDDLKVNFQMRDMAIAFSVMSKLLPSPKCTTNDDQKYEIASSGNIHGLSSPLAEKKTDFTVDFHGSGRMRSTKDVSATKVHDRTTCHHEMASPAISLYPSSDTSDISFQPSIDNRKSGTRRKALDSIESPEMNVDIIDFHRPDSVMVAVNEGVVSVPPITAERCDHSQGSGTAVMETTVDSTAAVTVSVKIAVETSEEALKVAVSENTYDSKYRKHVETRKIFEEIKLWSLCSS